MIIAIALAAMLQEQAGRTMLQLQPKTGQPARTGGRWPAPRGEAPIYDDIPALRRYQDTPNPDKADIRRCADEYDRLQSFNGKFKAYVFDHTLDRGGRLEWSEGNDIRAVSDRATQFYLDRIRYIAWQGRAAECRALADRGVEEVFSKAIRPVFGPKVTYAQIMSYTN
jgi:hypothetical protein